MVMQTGLGWLLGPTLGNTFWKMAHRAKMPQFQVKEREFFEHIKARRGDPKRSSVQNPIRGALFSFARKETLTEFIDYYGESIGM